MTVEWWLRYIRARDITIFRKSAFPWKADFLRARQFLAAFNLH